MNTVPWDILHTCPHIWKITDKSLVSVKLKHILTRKLRQRVFHLTAGKRGFIANGQVRRYSMIYKEQSQHVYSTRSNDKNSEIIGHGKKEE